MGNILFWKDTEKTQLAFRVAHHKSQWNWNQAIEGVLPVTLTALLRPYIQAFRARLVQNRSVEVSSSSGGVGLLDFTWWPGSHPVAVCPLAADPVPEPWWATLQLCSPDSVLQQHVSGFLKGQAKGGLVQCPPTLYLLPCPCCCRVKRRMGISAHITPHRVRHILVSFVQARPEIFAGCEDQMATLMGHALRQWQVHPLPAPACLPLPAPACP